MNLLERLTFLMERDGLNIHKLSIGSKVPYSTIDNFYKIGCERVKLPTLRKLADYFCCSIDYLVGDTDNPEKIEHVNQYPALTPAGQRIGRLYDKADGHDKETVEHVLSRYDDKKGTPAAKFDEKTG